MKASTGHRIGENDRNNVSVLGSTEMAETQEFLSLKGFGAKKYFLAYSAFACFCHIRLQWMILMLSLAIF
jgi:hypothetical protein